MKALDEERNSEQNGHILDEEKETNSTFLVTFDLEKSSNRGIFYELKTEELLFFVQDKINKTKNKTKNKHYGQEA